MRTPGSPSERAGAGSGPPGLGALERDDKLGVAVIRCLAESVAEGARRRPEAWGLTVLRRSGGARLNVGRVEVFLLDGMGEHFIVCLRKNLPPREAIERLGGSVAAAGHVTLTGPVMVRFPERSFARGYTLVRDAHFAAIAEAARHRHYSWKESHSPAAVRRVGDVAGVDLPDPLYAKSSRKTYLLTSNPETERDGFDGFRQGDAAKWRCWNKDPLPGDRLFWLRQGRHASSRGLFASGFVTEARGRDGKLAYRVEKAVDFSPAGLLPVAELVRAVPGGPWKTQRSGAAIADDDAQFVTQLWKAFLEGDAVLDADDAPEALEGHSRLAEVIQRARDLGLRSRKIASVKKALGRLVCEVPNCGFDFFAAYGELGRDFAIVHHEDPIGRRKRASKTTFSRLRIVCANCHAMIHRGGETRSLAALRISPAWRRRRTRGR